MKRCLTTLAALALGFSAFAGVQENRTFESRAFGKITVDYRESGKRNSRTEYRTKDAASARAAASKRMADLLAFGDVKKHPGQWSGTVLHLKNKAFWMLGVRGSSFIELFAESPDALKKLASGEGTMEKATERAYPRYLDGFDIAGPAIWVGGGGSNYKLPQDFEWLKKRRLAFCALDPRQTCLAAPGIIDSSVFDWHSKMAQKYDLGYRQLFFPSQFDWSWNITPLPYISGYPGVIGHPGFYLLTTLTAGGEEPVRQTDPYRWDLRRRHAKMVRNDPNFLGYHGCTEIPDAGINHLAGIASTPYIRELYRQYLKENLKLSLKEVGELHFNDPGKFRSWNDVAVPLPQDFLGAPVQDLHGIWEIAPDVQKKGLETEIFAQNSPVKWVKHNSNDPLLMIYSDSGHNRRNSIPTWMRRSFENKGNVGYLHIARANYHGNHTMPYRVWVNGTECKNITPDAFSQCFDLRSALRPGKNELTVCLPRGGAMAGYVFLNGTPLQPYPRMMRHLNRLYFDAVNFSAFLRMKKVEDDLASIRSVDPVRPLKLMATINMLDLSSRLSKKYGAYQHDTGGAGGYWAPMTGGRLARSYNTPWSCEQGGPPKDANALRRGITYYIMYGNDALDMVFGVGHYSGKPDVQKWFDDNLELIHTIGKMKLPRTQIALLRSSRATRLGFGEPWNWDFGRGALQGVGRNFSYLELPDVFDSKLIDSYPVVMDAGTVLMDRKEAEAIRDYVRRGGTFIAQHHTGRHSPDTADTNLLAQAFSLKIMPKAISEENYHRWPLAKIRVAQDSTLIPSLRGKEIDGCGVSIDYLNRKEIGAAKITNNGAKMITHAAWSDDGTAAVAEVKYGKGRFIILGAPFFSRMMDINGVWANDQRRNQFLDEFLTAAGARRDSHTGNRRIWAELWESKNGVYDLYPVARMEKNGEKTVRAAIRLRRSEKPTEVVEVSALNHPVVAAKMENGFIQIPEMEYEPMKCRVFIAPKSDLQRSGLRWLENFSQIWHPVAKAEREFPDIVPAKNIMPLDHSWQILRGTADKGIFMNPGYRAENAKSAKLGSMAAMGLPENAHILIRKEIALPEEWKNRRVNLVFNCQHWFWGIRPWGRLWINGEPANLRQPFVPSANAAFSLDVGKYAKSGKIILALEIDGTKADYTKQQSKPSGVTGLFYLESLPHAVAEQSLTGPWTAFRGLGDSVPAKVGQKISTVCFETEFVPPAGWKKKGSLFLASEMPLGWMILNGRTIMTPLWMKELDISGLVRDGKNTLRWIPNTLNSTPVYTQKAKQTLFGLKLKIYPKSGENE